MILNKPSINDPDNPDWIEFYDVCELCGEAYEMFYIQNWNTIIPEKYRELSICRSCLKEIKQEECE